MIFNFLSSILGPVTKLIDEVDTSDEERLRLRNELAKIETEVKLKALDLETTIYKGQTSIQTAELKQESFFVKAARPFATWSLVSIIIFTYVGSPFIKYIWDIHIPIIDDTAIITLGAISGTLKKRNLKIKGYGKWGNYDFKKI